MGEGGADAEKRVILQELQKKLTEANASLKQARATSEEARTGGMGSRLTGSNADAGCPEEAYSSAGDFPLQPDGPGAGRAARLHPVFRGRRKSVRRSNPSAPLPNLIVHDMLRHPTSHRSVAPSATSQSTCSYCRYFRKDKKDIVEEQQQQVTDGGGQMEGLVRIAESASHEIRAIEAELSEFLKSNQDVARQFLAQSR